MISNLSQFLCGSILVTVPTIVYGGTFILRLIIKPDSAERAGPLKQMFFRAGHAHAGVLVIFSLVFQVLLDHSGLSRTHELFVRCGPPVAAILIPLGFFLAVTPAKALRPTRAIYLIYVGAVVLAVTTLLAGFTLIHTSHLLGQRAE